MLKSKCHIYVYGVSIALLIYDLIPKIASDDNIINKFSDYFLHHFLSIS